MESHNNNTNTKTEQFSKIGDSDFYMETNGNLIHNGTQQIRNKVIEKKDKLLHNEHQAININTTVTSNDDRDVDSRCSLSREEERGFKTEGLNKATAPRKTNPYKTKNLTTTKKITAFYKHAHW